MRYFEDFSVGDRWVFGSWTLTEDEIIAFAAEYDPQPMHLDRRAAAATPFGSLIASGWQTTLKNVRMFVDGLMADTASLASPGVDEIRWLHPVRAGDVITAGAEVEHVEPSSSAPDRGRVHFYFYGDRSDGERVMSARGLFFIACRRPRSV